MKLYSDDAVLIEGLQAIAGVREGRCLYWEDEKQGGIDVYRNAIDVNVDHGVSLIRTSFLSSQGRIPDPTCLFLGLVVRLTWKVARRRSPATYLDACTVSLNHLLPASVCSLDDRRSSDRLPHHIHPRDR